MQKALLLGLSVVGGLVLAAAACGSSNGGGTGAATSSSSSSGMGGTSTSSSSSGMGGMTTSSSSTSSSGTGGAVPAPARVLISASASGPAAAEFIEIYNPGTAAVDLTHVYLSDNAVYYGIAAGMAWNPPTANVGTDFLVQFPPGTMIGPGAVLTI